MNDQIRDLTGQKFNRLTVIKLAYVNKHRSACWECLCDCGNIVVVRSFDLISGGTKSCGCLRIQRIHEIHTLPNDKAAFNRLYTRYKANAKTRNLEFEINEDVFRILTKQNCYFCGVEPKRVGKRNRSANRDIDAIEFQYIYNGIDRLDNFVGYTEKNCVACCVTCNKAKLTMNEKQFINWIDRAYNNLREHNRL